MMMNDTDSLKDNGLDNINLSGSLENVVQLPLAEILVVNSESTDLLCSGKQLDMGPESMLNIDTSFLLNSLKNSTNLSAKFINLDNDKTINLNLLDPPPKRQKMDTTEVDDDSLKKMLLSIQQSIMERLESIEKKVEKITTKCQRLEKKVEDMIDRQATADLSIDLTGKGRFGDLANLPIETTVADTPYYSPISEFNTEASYPEGSWLGNPESEAFRVRCSITPKELVSINETCTTPVKMALTLLDYLFDRETQACSNISGAGKHGKLQLDPVKIFGIRCHLMFMFGVTEAQWRRIKLNMDSKCRSAFRRKQKGQPLSVKSLREKTCNDTDLSSSLEKDSECNTSNAIELLSELTEEQQQSTLGQAADNNLTSDIVDSLIPQDHTVNIKFPSIIHTEHGDIQVIHTTLEELAQLKASNQVKIWTVSQN